MSNQPKPQSKPAAEPELVAVVNHEIRTFKLHTQVPGQEIAPPEHCKTDAERRQWMRDQPTRTLEIRSVAIGPGINYVPRDILAANRLVGDEPERMAGLEVVDPRRIPDAYAIGVAAKSGTRSALEQWRAAEPRANVRAAIDKRLAAMASRRKRGSVEEASA